MTNLTTEQLEELSNIVALRRAIDDAGLVMSGILTHVDLLLTLLESLAHDAISYYDQDNFLHPEAELDAERILAILTNAPP